MKMASWPACPSGIAPYNIMTFWELVILFLYTPDDVNCKHLEIRNVEQLY